MTVHVSRFINTLHSYHVTLTPPQVQSALQTMNSTSGPLSVQQGKQEARSLTDFLDTLQQPLKHAKALEAVAHLHGFRS